MEADVLDEEEFYVLLANLDLSDLFGDKGERILHYDRAVEEIKSYIRRNVLRIRGEHDQSDVVRPPAP